MAGVPVFVAEDSLHMQNALRDLLQSVGPFQVVGSAVGETQATEWLQQHQMGWCLAILDLILSEGSGFGLVRRFKMARPECKVVVFSEYATPAIKERLIELGADGAFLKSELKSFVGFLETVAAFGPVARAG